jgi:hypothetical protein
VLPITGACMCGGVRYEVSEPFVDAHFCHCTRCQRRSGGAFAAGARAAPGSFRITDGKELLASFDPGDGGWIKTWCSNCGGHVFSQDPSDSNIVSARMGTLDGDPGIRPSYHQFTDYAPVWLPVADDGLPRYPEQPPD